jgi:hypothetical protein
MRKFLLAAAALAIATGADAAEFPKSMQGELCFDRSFSYSEQLYSINTSECSIFSVTPTGYRSGDLSCAFLSVEEVRGKRSVTNPDGLKYKTHSKCRADSYEWEQWSTWKHFRHELRVKITSDRTTQRTKADFPESFQGPWCYEKTGMPVRDWNKYWLDTFKDKCGSFYLNVTSTGYWSGDPAKEIPITTCTFVTVRKVSGGKYQTHSRCREDIPVGSYEFETWDTWENPPITPGSHERPWLKITADRETEHKEVK